jgi:diguanylate cyclase (GGDEF)-like protein
MAQAPLGFLTWWAGDAVAVVVLGVPLILLRRPTLSWPGRAGALEAAGLLILVFVTPIVAVQVAGQRSYLFLCFVPLVWAALRWGIAVTAYTALALSVLTTYSVGHSLEAGVRLADLQLFMGTLCATALLLGSVVSQLHDLNSDLEDRVRDRTAELKAVNEQLAHEATHDRLTGLANRALFDDRLQNALDRRRRAPAAMVVALLDLDGFKRVNDMYGHESGDRVLSEVAARLLRCVRTEDTVARLGGDEFAVLLDAGVTQDALQAVTDRILAALAEPIAVGDTTLVIGASIGAAVTDGGIDPGTVLREADGQMYGVKRHGKGYLAMTDLVPA